MLRRPPQEKMRSILLVSESTDHKPPILLGLRIVLMASVVLFLLATMTEFYRAPAVHQIEPEETHHSVDDNLIVPGTRIGPATLGLSMGAVGQKLGKAKMRPHNSGVMYLYENLGLVIYAENDKVTSVTARSPLFSTRQGVRVGSDVDSVLASLGQSYELVGDEKRYVLHNWGAGWHVGIEDNLVTYFQITPTLMVGPTSSGSPSP